MGVMIQPLTHELAETFGLDGPEGVLVADLVADTPATEAGLEQGDVIVEYAGQAVSSPRELQAVVERSEIGAQHPIVVIRDGKRRTLQVTPREQPAEAPNAGSSRSAVDPSEPSRFEKLGLEVETLTPEVAEHLNVKADHGVVITDVQSSGVADRAGLAAGMVIVEANRKPVKTVDGFRKMLDEAGDRDTLLLIRSEHGSRFVVLRTED